MKEAYLVLPPRSPISDEGGTNENSIGDYTSAPIGGSGASRWQHGDLDTLASALEGAPMYVLGETEKFHFVTKAIPGKSRQQVLLAARYSLEDDIANDIDDVEVFVSDQPRNGEYAIAIVDSVYIDGLLGPLAKKGLNIAQIVPDAMLLAYDNDPALLIDANRVLIKYGPQSACAVELAAAPLLANKLIREAGSNGGTCHIARPEAQGSVDNELLESVRQDLENLAVQTIPVEQSAAQNFLAAIRRDQTPLGDLNLVPERHQLQGNTARRKLLWRLAAGIAIVAMLTQLGADWWMIEQTETVLETTRQAQQDVVKKSFPDIGRLVNAEAQVKRSLAALEQKGPPPAEFLNILSRSLDIPSRQALGIQILGLTFADGVLLLRTESKEMGHLEEYRAGLNEFLSAEVVSAEASGNVVRGAIRVTAK